MEKSRLEQQFRFALEIDKEKRILRQTTKSGMAGKENDAEHAWHMAVMAMVLKEYANEEIDVLRTIELVLTHDLAEIYAGDTYAYDEEGKKDQKEREDSAAERLFGLLPDDQKEYFLGLFREFQECETPESRFANALDNVQPAMLNASNRGGDWRSHGVKLSWILKRNEKTGKGSAALWDYSREHFIRPNVEAGAIESDTEL